MWEVDSKTGERRPSSAAFKPNSDGLSVYCKRLLEEVNLTPFDIRINESDNIFSLTVEQVRGQKPLGIRDDRWPKGIIEESHRRNNAHALIIGWQKLSSNQRKLIQRYLAANCKFWG
jgi:hypothetical protein